MFCRKCGKEKDAKPTGSYDPETGEPVTQELCVNPDCEDGKHNLCAINGGHKWGFWGRCKKCGYSEPVYW